MGFDAVWSDESSATFRRNVLHKLEADHVPFSFNHSWFYGTYRTVLKLNELVSEEYHLLECDAVSLLKFGDVSEELLPPSSVSNEPSKQQGISTVPTLHNHQREKLERVVFTYQELGTTSFHN
jgi:hypothetical protein